MILFTCVCVCVCAEKTMFAISCVLCAPVLATGILSSIGFRKQVKNCSHRFTLLATLQIELEICMETGNVASLSFFMEKTDFQLHLKRQG
jgi:hypothetical protein